MLSETPASQMKSVGDKVYFGWTDVTNEIEAVKTAYVLLDLFRGGFVNRSIPKTKNALINTTSLFSTETVQRTE